MLLGLIIRSLCLRKHSKQQNLIPVAPYNFFYLELTTAHI